MTRTELVKKVYTDLKVLNPDWQEYAEKSWEDRHRIFEGFPEDVPFIEFRALVRETYLKLQGTAD